MPLGLCDGSNSEVLRRHAGPVESEDQAATCSDGSGPSVAGRYMDMHLVTTPAMIALPCIAGPRDGLALGGVELAGIVHIHDHPLALPCGVFDLWHLILRYPNDRP